MIHANEYDGIRMWCEVDEKHALDCVDIDAPNGFAGGGQGGSVEPSEMVKVDCPRCLAEIMRMGRHAESRLRVLRHQAGRCPILAHADDCDCDGSLGDR